MDITALFKLSYGVFVTGSKSGEKINACITNTTMQVTVEPLKIVFATINQNLTTDYIKESGEFSISILDNTTTFDTIKHFGMQSGRDVDKFKDFEYKLSENGIPYIEKGVTAVITGKVLEQTDLGTHTLFVAEVTDAFNVSGNPPLTYADYHARVKPQPNQNKEKKIVGWRCTICNYVFEGPNIPKDFICPVCGHPVEDFEPIYEE